MLNQDPTDRTIALHPYKVGESGKHPYFAEDRKAFGKDRRQYRKDRAKAEKKAKKEILGILMLIYLYLQWRGLLC